MQVMERMDRPAKHPDILQITAASYHKKAAKPQIGRVFSRNHPAISFGRRGERSRQTVSL